MTRECYHVIKRPASARGNAGTTQKYGVAELCQSIIRTVLLIPNSSVLALDSKCL